MNSAAIRVRFSLNKPEGTNSQYSVAEANDPTKTCDPVGFPRDVLWNNRAMTLAQMPDRVVELFQYQKIWREIFTDGRALPKDVGTANGPDESRRPVRATARDRAFEERSAGPAGPRHPSRSFTISSTTAGE